MDNENGLKMFQNKNIRVEWNSSEEKWYFSVVDIVSVLTDNNYQAGRKYWKTLKMRLNQEGSQLVTNCYQLKMKSTDGKYYNTDVMDTEQILRLIQSIPTKKAEPFKLWLAKVGAEIAKKTKPKGMPQTKTTVVKGATVAKEAREKIEKETGGKIVSSKNAIEMRDIKGITLIALIVTIIIMLILAGVAITAFMGENGLISRARQASEETKEKAEEERSILNMYYNMLSEATGDLAISEEDFTKLAAIVEELTTIRLAELKPVTVVPNYTNIESTNRITTNNGTWTADKDGFIKCTLGRNMEFGTICRRDVCYLYQ